MCVCAAAGGGAIAHAGGAASAKCAELIRACCSARSDNHRSGNDSAAATGKPLPATPGAPADPAATVTTAAIAANVAENYTRALECIARLNALIDWHTESAKAVK